MKNWKTLNNEYNALLDKIIGVDKYPQKSTITKEERDRLMKEFWEGVQEDAIKEAKSK